MTILVLAAAVLLACAAFFKVRASMRFGIGVSVLVMLEMVGAIMLLVVGLPGPFSGTVIAKASVPLALLILFVATVDHARRLGAIRERRNSTEGGRLAAYVKYQRGGSGGDASEPSDTA